MSVFCREGHVSDEADYCSVCGVPIGAARGGPCETPLPSSVKSALPGACPECGEPRTEPDARFCEVCRYDFVARKAGPPPAGPRPFAPSASSPASSEAKNAPRAPAVPVVARWELHVAVDPLLDKEPDPAAPCPRDVPVVVVALDRPELLVGRHDERRDIHPEIAVRDPGASRRHAKIIASGDGGVALQDLASTNGTRLNGVDLAPGSRTTLHDGDEISLGRWTRITLRSRP